MNLALKLPLVYRFGLISTLAVSLITLSHLITRSSEQVSSALFHYAETVAMEEGIKEETTGLFQVIPSPLSQPLRIEMKEAGFLHVTGVENQIERKYWMQPGINDLDLSHLPRGIYMLWSGKLGQKTVEKVFIH